MLEPGFDGTWMSSLLSGELVLGFDHNSDAQHATVPSTLPSYDVRDQPEVISRASTKVLSSSKMHPVPGIAADCTFGITSESRDANGPIVMMQGNQNRFSYVPNFLAEGHGTEVSLHDADGNGLEHHNGADDMPSPRKSVPIEWFPCDKCLKSYLKKGTLLRHKREVHNGRELRCSNTTCKRSQIGKGFKRRYKLKQHKCQIASLSQSPIASQDSNCRQSGAHEAWLGFEQQQPTSSSAEKEAEVNDATSPKLWSGCENELRRWVETEQLIDGRITVLKLVPEDRGQLRELVHCYESKENCRRQIQRLQIPI